MLSGHAVQSVSPPNEYVFTPHDVQATGPGTVLYVPTSQGVHSTPSDEAVYPATQVQSVSTGLLAAEKVLSGHGEQLVAAADEYVLASQAAHVPTPVAVVLYSPAIQDVHSTPSNEAMYPARQVQFVCSGLFSAEKVLSGHSVQVAAPASE